MIKLFVITFGNREAGSTQYRIVNYESFLLQHGVSLEYANHADLNDAHLKSISQADVLINQKSLFDKSLAKKIIKSSKRIIFDFDDAIYTRPGKAYSWMTQWRVTSRLKQWLTSSNHVIAANHYLKSYADKYSDRVTVIPMALDLNIWKPKVKTPQPTMTMGWAGAPANLYHIERIEPVLARLLSRFPNLKLSIFSGRKPNLTCPFDYVPFQSGCEQSFIQSLDIGLLPLSDEEFSKGKSPIKAIQYLACGVPVVANIYGATHDILNPSNSFSVCSEDEWLRGVQTFVQDRELATQMGKSGRLHVEKHFNQLNTREQLLKLIVA